MDALPHSHQPKVAFFKNRTVCGRTLPTKIAMSVVVTEDCGEIESSYWCKVCERFSAQVDMSDDDTITLGEFRHNEPDVWETIRAEVEEETT